MRAGAAVAVLAALLAGAARADIYTWRDAAGVKRMSNVAPDWYGATEPSRIRTQVLVNGILVDDTGLPTHEREKLQARRAKAESLGRPGTSAPVPPPVAVQAPAPPPKPGPTGVTPPPRPPVDLPDAAKSAEGLKRALEAQKMADSLADQLKTTSRPRQ